MFWSTSNLSIPSSSLRSRDRALRELCIEWYVSLIDSSEIMAWPVDADYFFDVSSRRFGWCLSLKHEYLTMLAPDS